jgi:uncharacterized protein YdeI (YjbR/CyaY-like superfamily)
VRINLRVFDTIKSILSIKETTNLEPKNVLDVKTTAEFRQWLAANHQRETECWAATKRGKNKPADTLWYLEAVETAMCFGWIDTTQKRINGVTMQRFMPRSPRSTWSELNKERCRRLERLGLITEAGRRVLPDMSEDAFKIDPEIQTVFAAHPKAWSNFQTFPKLYQRVRIDNIQRYKQDRVMFQKRLQRLIEQSEQGKMYGQWNDYGRLS